MLPQLVSRFAPLINAVAGKRLVKGTLTLEIMDKSNGWIFDYESSKSEFKAWFNEIHNATGGKSWGNVRLMHQLRVAGKIAEEPVFDDANKVINCTVEVTDDEVWSMVENGLLCGFSFSGVKVPPSQEVLAKWANLPDGSKRYKARPFELSFVDNPNQAGAYWKVVSNGIPGFDYTDESGKTENRFFVSKGAEPTFEDSIIPFVNSFIETIKNTVFEEREIKMETTTTTAPETPTTPVVEKIVNAAEMKGIMSDILTEFRASLVTEILGQVKTEISNAVGGIDVVGIKESVTELSEKLAKTPAPTTVVTATPADTPATPVFNAAANSNTVEEDKKALGLIHNIMTVKKA